MKLDPRIETLLSTDTIRERAAQMLAFAQKGKTNFEVHLDKLPLCADLVVQTTRENYPDLKIPFHSRWGHFKAGKIDRVKDLDQKLSALDVADRARAKIDLVVVSVLLDAGAGMAWKFQEGMASFSKSEGLAIASLHMFLNGAFSSDPRQPLRADAAGLRGLKRERLEKGFQVGASNPLVGVEGRLGLLHALGKAIEAQPGFFPGGRVGGLYDWYKAESVKGKLPAVKVLRGVQLALGSIWPGRLSIDGFNLGDVWKHKLFGDDWVPFHKLSQWLSYSLIEPLTEAGLEVTAFDKLTGLPEYRNGGLFIDTGVLTLRNAKLAAEAHKPDSELVIEWRALTVALLERVADLVRQKLHMTNDSFPLGKVLEGGTWATGRKIAAKLRVDGGPPLKIDSDGTVF